MPNNPGVGDVLVEIDIRDEDIAEMDYHLNECPMANMARENAVAYALDRVVRPGHRISVSAHRGSTFVEIGERKIPLGNHLTLWLANAMMGHRQRPMKAMLSLPEVILRANVAARGKKMELIQFYSNRFPAEGPNRAHA